MKVALPQARTDWILSGAPVNAGVLDRFLSAELRRAARSGQDDGLLVLRALTQAVYAGATVPAALAALATDGDVRRRAICTDLAEQVRHGASLAQALAARPRTFGSEAGDLLAAYETACPLPDALGYVCASQDIAGARRAAALETAAHAARESARTAAVAAAATAALWPAVATGHRPLATATFLFAAVAVLAAGALWAKRAADRAPRWVQALVSLGSSDRPDAVATTLALLSVLTDRGVSTRAALDAAATAANGSHGRDLVVAAQAAWGGATLAEALEAADSTAAAGEQLRGLASRPEVAAALASLAQNTAGPSQRRTLRRLLGHLGQHGPSVIACALLLVSCWLVAR